MAFGDLFLEEIRHYRETQMAGTGMRCHFPLWGRPTRALAEEMIDSGVRARLTCVDPRALDASFAGREFDRVLLADLPPHVDPCGENGEFHTFAWDGPMFSHPVPIQTGDVVTRDGFVFADLLPVHANESHRGTEDVKAHGKLRTFLALTALLWLAIPAAATEAPRRVASINLAADEVLVDIVPLERLVSVTAFADDPDNSNIVGRVPASVTRFLHADLERLLALHPDLVVVSEFTDADFLHLLKASGLRFHRMAGLDSIEGIRKAILELGRAVGAEAEAQRLAERFDRSLRDLDTRLAGVRRPRVMYWSEPHTAGEGTVIGAIIERAGAVNVGRELGLTGVLPIGAERAFAANPDAVMIGRSAGAREALVRHPVLSRLPAVREGRIVEMPGSLIVPLSHYVADASWVLAHALHPDRVPAKRP
jgi:ABC-type Fe3+-hydroxamate transport system substrate-binding protein